jgi:hypothetical protein
MLGAADMRDKHGDRVDLRRRRPIQCFGGQGVDDLLHAVVQFFEPVQCGDGECVHG